MRHRQRARSGHCSARDARVRRVHGGVDAATTGRHPASLGRWQGGRCRTDVAQCGRRRAQHLRTARGSLLVCWGYDVWRNSPPAGAFQSVSITDYHGCGVRDGTVACWGQDRQVGRMDEGKATPPVGAFASVSAGCPRAALRADGPRHAGAIPT